MNRSRFIYRQQSVHGSWVRKKVAVTTMESSRSHREARSRYVYKCQLATQVDRTSNIASSRPPDSNRKPGLRLPEHPKSLTPCHQNLVTMNGCQWSKHAVLAALVLTSICCAVLTLQVLCKESNKKAGIATLHIRGCQTQKGDAELLVLSILPW